MKRVGLFIRNQIEDIRTTIIIQDHTWITLCQVSKDFVPCYILENAFEDDEVRTIIIGVVRKSKYDCDITFNTYKRALTDQHIVEKGKNFFNVRSLG